VEEIT